MSEDQPIPLPARDPLDVLEEAAGHLAFLATETIYAEQPMLWARGKHGRFHTHNDFVLHFEALAQGPQAFANHIAYTRRLFNDRGFPAQWVTDALRIMADTCTANLAPEVANIAREAIEAAKEEE